MTLKIALSAPESLPEGHGGASSNRGTSYRYGGDTTNTSGLIRMSISQKSNPNQVAASYVFWIRMPAIQCRPKQRMVQL